MSAVMKAERALPVESTATPLLQAITKAASDPAVDIEKMERLFAMHERIVARDAETAFNDAMTECQKEMRSIATDAENPQTRSRYATYTQLDRVLRPIYTAHGFAISYNTADSPKPEHVRVLAYVSRGLHTRTYQVDMPADGKGAKGGDVMTKTHASGAAMSYGQRYLLKGIFNVRIGEEDNDGNGADPKESAKRFEHWKKEIEATTGKDAAKKVWVVAIKECDKAKDVNTSGRLNGILSAHCAFIDSASK